MELSVSAAYEAVGLCKVCGKTRHHPDGQQPLEGSDAQHCPDCAAKARAAKLRWALTP